jgi:predicted signal transduction protein with EAL and GGDEF domain
MADPLDIRSTRMSPTPERARQAAYLDDRIVFRTVYPSLAREQSCVNIGLFKTGNDTLGHAVGDEPLKAVADRLRALVWVADTVARAGGDEFVANADQLTRSADLALYRAKADGRGNGSLLRTGYRCPDASSTSPRARLAQSVGQ